LLFFLLFCSGYFLSSRLKLLPGVAPIEQEILHTIWQALSKIKKKTSLFPCGYGVDKMTENRSV
jgi:hypothetical protein